MTITSFLKITDELIRNKERIMERKKVVDAEEIKVKLNAFSDTIIFTITGADTWSLLQESAHLASAAIILVLRMAFF